MIECLTVEMGVSLTQVSSGINVVNGALTLVRGHFLCDHKNNCAECLLYDIIYSYIKHVILYAGSMRN